MKIGFLVLAFGLILNINGLSAANTKARHFPKKTKQWQAKKVAISYIKWYVANQKSFNYLAADILTRNSKDSLYEINFIASEKYLTCIKKSGYVSDRYINSLRAFFIDCDNDLKAYSRREGTYPPLDYDFILKIQEEDDIVKHLNQLRLISNQTTIKKSKIVFFIKASRLKLIFHLSKSSAKWLIDSFDPDYLPLK